MWADLATDVTGRLLSRRSNFYFRLDRAISAEKPIPKEIDHGEIAVPLAMVDEMELLLASEPQKAAKPRSRDMILVVDIIMTAE
jgi:hypothetical protein